MSTALLTGLSGVKNGMAVCHTVFFMLFFAALPVPFWAWAEEALRRLQKQALLSFPGRLSPQ